MLQHYAAVRRVATAIANAAETAVVGLRAGRVQGEETFTDRMIGAIEERLQGGVTTEELVHESKSHTRQLAAIPDVLDNSPSITWSALTLTAHKRGAQEKSFGADFLGALEIRLPDYHVKKGFLSQAKLTEPDARMTSREFTRLQKQCNKMLSHTSDSFIFLYSTQGIRVASALGIVGMTNSTNPYHTYTRSLERFFEEHLQCFVGDRRIRAATPEALNALRTRLDARTGFLLVAEEL